MVGERLPTGAALDLSRWHLEVAGLVNRPLTMTWREVMAMSGAERTVDIHCVTSWTRQQVKVRGVPLATLVGRAGGAAEGARFVRFEAYSPRRHDTSLPLALALEDTWLVHEIDGRPLTIEHGFPLRAVTPSRYFYKSCKWLHRIELLAEDQLGYWERESAYHNNANPWPGDERFTTGSVRLAQVEAFRHAEDYAKWRGRVLAGVDLAGWAPSSKDLRSLELKGCDLRGAALQGCDLRSANLSLSNLAGACVRGADLRGADLEGADFTGADLRDSDLRDCSLCATRFTSALVTGVRYEGASGLLEDAEALLSVG